MTWLIEGNLSLALTAANGIKLDFNAGTATIVAGSMGGRATFWTTGSNTQATAIGITNAIPTTGAGTFNRIVFTKPLGVTNETVSFVDVDGTSLFTTNIAGGMVSNIVWNGTVIHGGYKIIMSGVTTTNGAASPTNSFMILETK